MSEEIVEQVAIALYAQYRCEVTADTEDAAMAKVRSLVGEGATVVRRDDGTIEGVVLPRDFAFPEGAREISHTCYVVLADGTIITEEETKDWTCGEIASRGGVAHMDVTLSC